MLSISKNILTAGRLSSYVGSRSIHLAVDRDTSFNFPEANRLPLPSNIDSHESTRFSPLRSQNVVTSNQITVTQKILDVTLTQKPEEDKPFVNLLSEDHCLKGYECHGFNLSSAMQSTVPEAFNNNNNNVSYLHFPGGGWGQQTKYLSHELNSSHFTSLRQDFREENWYNQKKGKCVFNILHLRTNLLDHPKLHWSNKRFISSNSSNNSFKGESESQENHETGKAKLKRAVKDYGKTVIVFHISISLMSLGVFYTLIKSGLDITTIVEKFNLSDKFPIVENASTFIIAYAVHKVFAPFRIGITLICSPIIVRYLRSKKFLKK